MHFSCILHAFVSFRSEEFICSGCSNGVYAMDILIHLNTMIKQTTVEYSNPIP